jgi:hypothetical protein
VAHMKAIKCTIHVANFDKSQAKLKKFLGFVSRLVYKGSNPCDSLGTNERNYFVRNDYLHQRTLQCSIWIL